MDEADRRTLARLLRESRIAHLATLREGAPMCSMTPYLAAPDFSAFYLHVSALAWHTQDMAREGRVALSVAEADDGRDDPFTLARVAIRGEAQRLAADPAELKAAWLARFPAQAIHFELGDFAFWRIAPRDARFVAGFGRIYNLSVAQLAEAAREA
ncbi:MAG: pyridoxamine 5'-phosphate oxidase family protein [Burkholderiales bacterium]|nr:pyridoxamine 5'-phosphate oxidase family protein [Burkholderiales bacterium]